MPELPEVEVVKKSLQKNIKNLTIKKVKINDNNLRYRIRKNQFNKTKNQKILNIKRRSKYIIINLSNQYSIIVHLGMTGKFNLVKKEKLNKTSFYYDLANNSKKHDHVIFFLNQDIRLIYNDIRKFGFIKILKTSSISNNSHFKTLGPEPLSINFNFSYLKERLLGKKLSIKDFLMSQKNVSGLGNIYVNEILFKSKIKPTRSAMNIKDDEILKLIKNTKKILKESISKGGSTIKNFENDQGVSGKFQDNFKVYGRNEKKCLSYNCNDNIKKIVINNRSSFLCNSCQK